MIATASFTSSAAPRPRAWNPWPAGIAGFLVFFFGVTIGLVVLAVRQPADLVGRDYYDQEIRFQSQIDRVSRAQALPGQVSVGYDAVGGALRVALPSIPAGEHPTGEVKLYRPSDANLDRAWPLAVNAEGVQVASAPRLASGLWRVDITWTTSRGSYSASRAINAPGN